MSSLFPAFYLYSRQGEGKRQPEAGGDYNGEAEHSQKPSVYVSFARTWLVTWLLLAIREARNCVYLLGILPLLIKLKFY